MKSLLIVTAVIELGAGTALMLAPAVGVRLLLGVPLEGPAALTVARVGGAGVLTLGVACWLGRGDTQGRAARGLVAAMLLYNVAAASFIAFAGIGYGLRGVALWPAVMLHTAMAAWCIACLRQKHPG